VNSLNNRQKAVDGVFVASSADV